jgi:hypothetical protein
MYRNWLKGGIAGSNKLVVVRLIPIMITSKKIPVCLEEKRERNDVCGLAWYRPWTARYPTGLSNATDCQNNIWPRLVKTSGVEAVLTFSLSNMHERA